MKHRVTFAAACLIVQAGCVQSSRGPDFEKVRSVVAARTGLEVRWNQGTQADAEVAERVGQILLRPLSADDAVQVALLNNRRMRAVYERLGVAQADVVEAGLLENPVFHFRPRWPDRAPAGTNLELGVEWDFLQALMIPARQRLARIQFEHTQLGVTHEVLTFVAQVRETYYALVASEQLTAVLRTVAQATEASFEFAQRASDAGNLPDIDVDRQQALHEEAKLEYARARLESSDARERLNSLMGLWGQQTAWSVPQQLPGLPSIEPPLDHLESTAIANRLDLAEACREAEALSAALGITRDWRLFVFAQIGIDAERDSGGQWVTGPELQVELPFFNQRETNIARQEAELRASEDRLTALAVEIRSEVRALRMRLLLARQVVERYRDVIVPLHQRIGQLSEQRYNFMLIGVFEALETRKDEIRAYRDYLSELRDYWITRARLERAIGTRLPVETGLSISGMAAPAPADDHQTTGRDPSHHQDHNP